MSHKNPHEFQLQLVVKRLHTKRRGTGATSLTRAKRSFRTSLKYQTQNILKTYTLSQVSASITFLLNISININISIIMNIFVPKLRLSNRTEKVQIFSHENSLLLLRVSIHSLKQKGYVDFALQTNENARIITLKNCAMCSEYFRKDERCKHFQL